MDDWKLLAAYAEHGDDEAFASLVSRHIGLVYGAAYRKLENAATAEEVAQSVFVLLAKKAGSLKPSGSLAGWLYTAACHQAIDLYRKESARRRRERTHVMDEEPTPQELEIHWPDIAPILDDAMQTLAEQDRTAVLLRYFEERSLRDISEAIGMSEEAARKRVARALERLRLWFNKRGIECTNGTLGVALGAYAAISVPPHVKESTLHAALTQTATPISTTTTVTTTMASIKLPITIGLLAGAAVPLSLGHRPDSKPEIALPKLVPIKADVSLPAPELNGLIAEWMALREAHGPNGGSMSDFYEAVQKLKDDFKRRAFRTAVVADWAASAPTEALAYFSKKNDRIRITDVLRVWLENDPSAALSAMRLDGDQWSEPIADLLTEIADTHPQALADLAPYVRSKAILDQRVLKAFAKAARRDLSGMREAAETLSGKARQEALAGVAKAWAETDGEAALTWVNQFESSADRSRALQELLIGWAARDPVGALDRLDLAPPGGLAKVDGQAQVVGGLETSDRVLKVAAATNLEATLDWLLKNPGKYERSHVFSNIGGALAERFFEDMPETLAMIRDHDATDILREGLSYILSNPGKGYVNEVWEWAGHQPPSRQVTAIKKTVYASLVAQEPDRALELAQSLIQQGDPEAIHFGIFRHQIVQDLESYEQAAPVMAHAPEALRHELLQFALMRSSEMGVDSEKWTHWLGQLPAEARKEVVIDSLKNLASHDPMMAIENATAVAEADRPDAFREISKRWAESDSYTASQWLATLEPSAERDSATLALVQTIARSEPDSAWHWSQTIATPKQRQQAMRTVLRQFGDAAPDILATSTLDPREVSELQQWYDAQPDHSN